MKAGLGLVRSLEDRVRLFAREQGLWKRGDRGTLAVSGGADSLCMLHLVARLAVLEGFSLVVAYLHHGMRPVEGEEERHFVEEQARHLDLLFMSGRADVPELAKSRGIGLEEAGRHARREFLDRVRQETASDWIATAHTRTDHVETVLLHLFRGAGLHGISGILPRGYGGRIRPLLPLSREETVAFCTVKGLRPRHDPANEKMEFLRNRIRRTVLPLLREQVNPAVDEALCRFSEAAAECLELVEEAGRELYERARTENPGLFQREPLRKAPAAARSEAVRLLLEKARGTPEGLSYVDIRRVTGLLESGGRATLLGGDIVDVSGSCLRITCSGAEQPGRQDGAGSAYALSIPGAVWLPAGGFVKAEPGDGLEEVGPQRNTAMSVWVKAQPPLTIRYACHGDRVRPLGRGGNRKLKELFIEAKIPTWEREHWPVIVDREGILWVPGLAIADRAALASGELASGELASGELATWLEWVRKEL